MKKLFIILLLTLPARMLCAQTFAEWFKQGKTQKKYLLEQIAALEVSAGYLEKGYAIAQSGLDAIHNIKTGDFGLHTDYFKSLKAVNLEIKNDARVASIITLYAQIKKVASATSRQAKNSTQIAATEKVYIEQVLNNLMRASDEIVTNLLQIVSPDQLELTDDQRWKNIGKLYDDMKEKYVFSKSFAPSVGGLIASRAAAQRELENQKSVLDIK